jgi:hypothetical protein
MDLDDVVDRGTGSILPGAELLATLNPSCEPWLALPFGHGTTEPLADSREAYEALLTP